MSKYEELAKKVSILVGADKTEKAIEILQEERISFLEKDLRKLESRLNRVRKAQLSGTIDSNFFSLELNRINHGLPDLTSELGAYL